MHPMIACWVRASLWVYCLVFIYCLPQPTAPHRPSALLYFLYLLTVATQTNVGNVPHLNGEGSGYQFKGLKPRCCQPEELTFFNGQCLNKASVTLAGRGCDSSQNTWQHICLSRVTQILTFAFLCPAGSGNDIYPPVASL